MVHASPSLTLSAQTARQSVQRAWAKLALELLILLACLVPGLVFSFSALQEPWTAFRLARANISVEQGRVATFTTSAAGYRSEHIGGEIVQSALISATGEALESIGLLPIGALMLTIMYYALARVVSRSWWTPIAVAVYANYYYPGLNNQFATQTYVWTNVLFFCFLLVFWYWLHHRSTVLSITAIVIFIATFLHYHSTPIWIIIALCAVIASDVLKKQAIKNWSIVLFCIVLYATFDTVMYGNGLLRIASDQTAESFAQSFMHKIISPLFARNTAALAPFEVAPLNSRLATWSTLAVLLLLTVPVGAWCLCQVYRAVKERSIAAVVSSPADLFIWSMLAVTVAHTVMYSFYGAISIRVVQLVFPLLLPLVVRSLRHAKHVELGLAASIAVAAVVGFGSFVSTLQPYTLASQTGFAAKLIQPESKVLADANTYGSLLLQASEDQQIIDFTWLDANRYAAVTGQQPIAQAAFDYLAVDTSGKPIIAANWRFFQPWVEQMPQIDRNPELAKVYDSEHMSLYQPIERSLPAARVGDVETSPSRATQTVRLFAAVLFLLWLPGWGIVVLARPLRRATANDAYVLVALSVGMSIVAVTVIGYIVNFGFLSLDWLLPLTAAVIGLSVGWFFWRRSAVAASARYFACLGAVCVAFLAWALLASGVAEARTARNAAYTEFFVTQKPAQAGVFEVHAVNRLAEAQRFEVHLFAGDHEFARSAATLLDQRQTWTTEWAVPPEHAGDRIRVVLTMNGAPHRQLAFVAQEHAAASK